MQIIVVGAGLAGLSAAVALTYSKSSHTIVLLESATRLTEVGAGVQLTPVATRQFQRWGLGPNLLAAAAVPDSWSLRRGSDGTVLNRVPMKELGIEYGGPYIVIHRADLHRILHEHATRRGVEVRLNSRVLKYGFEEGYVTLSNGDRLEADLIVACDGIDSEARAQFLRYQGVSEEAKEATGWAAYRAMVDVEEVAADPIVTDIVGEHAGNCWAGTNTSFMTYMVRESAKLNLVISHRDDVDTSSWSQEQFHAELKRLTTGMDPRVRRIVNLIKAPITNWPVYQVRNLPTWISESGKYVLMGDGAHAMAFYLSMGVSLAVEDAAALASALELHIKAPSQTSLPEAMQIFEEVRKPRAEAVRNASLHAGNMLHLGPGSQRDARDQAAMNDGVYDEALRKGDPLTEWISYGITDKTIRDWCYGYDVIETMKSLAARRKFL